MKIVIKKTGWLKEKYQFNVVVKSGKVVATSEKYDNLIDCDTAIKLIQSQLSSAIILMEWE